MPRWVRGRMCKKINQSSDVSHLPPLANDCASVLKYDSARQFGVYLKYRKRGYFLRKFRHCYAKRMINYAFLLPLVESFMLAFMRLNDFCKGRDLYSFIDRIAKGCFEWTFLNASAQCVGARSRYLYFADALGL